MASSLFGKPSRQQSNGNMIQQFAAFKKQMAGKNPEQIVKQMLADGRMTPEQFEKLKAQAQSLVGVLR